MPRILFDEIVMPEEVSDPNRIWLVAGIVAAVVAVSVVVCVILVKRRKKKGEKQ